MTGKLLKKAASRSAVLPAAALLVGLAGGTALAYNASHNDIVLKDAAGSVITSLTGNAYSVKKTCFDTVGCHGTGSTGTLKLTYDELERHSYHAMNGSNELRGFNAPNPDGVLPDGSADPFRRGATPQGKNWVQSPAHIGSW